MLRAMEVRDKMPSVIKARQEFKVWTDQVDKELTEKINVAAENDLSSISYIFKNENEYDWFKGKLENLGYDVQQVDKYSPHSSSVLALIGW